MCGEKHPGDRFHPGDQGSPPRVRGKGVLNTDYLARKRITPACAGKSSRTAGAGKRCADHPRVCGEKILIWFTAAIEPGSPPRVRGKVRTSGEVYNELRITPACAGKSDRQWRRQQQAQDHPRVCGEKLYSAFRKLEDQGSPPRVRGKVWDVKEKLIADRITPACAGKSRGPRFAATPKGDHPRVCGEKLEPVYQVAAVPGSPPRVRGKVRGVLDAVGQLRITPACAGKRGHWRNRPPG